MLLLISDTEYARLLYVLKVNHDPASNHTHLTQVARLLQVSMALVSDCVRWGYVVSTVLDAATDKGINPEFIKAGRLPVYLE